MKFSTFVVVAVYNVILSVLNLSCSTANFNGMTVLVLAGIEVIFFTVAVRCYVLDS